MLVHAGIVDRQRFALNLVDEGNKIERFLLKTAPADKVDSLLRKRVAAIHFNTADHAARADEAERGGRAVRRRRNEERENCEACRPDYEPASGTRRPIWGPTTATTTRPTS